MDDWSLLPSRNAVREPAPDPQSTMTTTNAPCHTSPARVKRHQPGAENPCTRTQRLTRQAEPGSSATKSGAQPRNPFHDSGSR
jgi:hypothetical protein